LGKIHVARAEFTKATEVLERALKIRTDQEGDPVEAARTRFVLARARWHQDRGAAIDLAQDALEALEAGGPTTEREAARVRAWLTDPDANM
jgi:hypothetical protein